MSDLDSSLFDPTAWRDTTIADLVAAGARHVQLWGPASVAFEWPVPGEARTIPLAIAQQDGGTLLVVSLYAWRVSVTPTTAQLVDRIARHVSRKAGEGFLEVQWQYDDQHLVDAPFSIDDYVYATGPDWRALLLDSARRFAQVFVVLDPLLKAAADGVFHAGAAHVALLRLAATLKRPSLSPEALRMRDAFPAVTKERFDDGVLRAIKLEGAPETALQALDQPLLADVDEATMYFHDDAVTRWLDGGRLPRPLRSVEITGLDAERPELVCALLVPFQDCTTLSLILDDEERFRDVTVAVDGATPSFAQLEVLDIVCDANAAVEKKLLDLLFSQPLPKLRRFTLDSRTKRSGAAVLAPILKRLPSTVTELGLWQPAPGWKALREKLLTHKVLATLTTVGVNDDLDEIEDPRLAGKRLFGSRMNLANVAHDLNGAGRHQDVVDMLGPIRWKSDDADISAHYATALSQLDPVAGARAWREALTLSPRDHVITHNLANQLMAIGHVDEAEPFVVAAHEMDPANPWMQRCLAVIAKHRGDHEGADRHASRFIQSATEAVVDADNDGDGADGAARYELACAQMWAGLPDAALDTLEEAVAAGLRGVTPALDIEWAPLRDDPRWRRLFPQ